jgi:hypothetical protein
MESRLVARERMGDRWSADWADTDAFGLMPTPKPSTETREEWLDRCIPAVLEDGAAADQNQAVAMCSQMWRDATKEIAMDERQQAWGLLTIKAMDEDRRLIQGIATTPAPDRVGDIVEPLGVHYKNPLPLLHQHDSKNPEGTAPR